MPKRPNTLVCVLSILVFVVGGMTVNSQSPSGTKAWVGGPALSYPKVEVTIDLPEKQHVENFGAPKDGKGLCVFAAMDMGARWHHVTPLIGIIKKLDEGGGWPEKVDKVIAKHAPGLSYVQYDGKDPAILDNAMAHRMIAMITYGCGERYNNNMGTIYHMVVLVHLDSKYGCIVDSNFPGTYEWMPRKELLRRWAHPTGQGWAYVFLVSPPPPIPINRPL